MPGRSERRDARNLAAFPFDLDRCTVRARLGTVRQGLIYLTSSRGERPRLLAGVIGRSFLRTFDRKHVDASNAARRLFPANVEKSGQGWVHWPYNLRRTRTSSKVSTGLRERSAPSRFFSKDFPNVSVDRVAGTTEAHCHFNSTRCILGPLFVFLAKHVGTNSLFLYLELK